MFKNGLLNQKLIYIELSDYDFGKSRQIYTMCCKLLKDTIIYRDIGYLQYVLYFQLKF